MAAALALDGARGFEERFPGCDGEKGRSIFEDLNALEGIRVSEFKHGSNIFPLAIDAV